MDMLAIGLLVIFLHRIELVKPLKKFNEEYLSLKSTNMLRGLFALVILCFHLTQRTSGGIVFHQFIHVGHLAVAGFFFFSGYGLQKKYMTDESYSKQFLLHRIPPVLVPCVIVVAVYFLVYAVQGRLYFYRPWYVINILIFYVVYYMLMFVCKKSYAGMIIGASVFYAVWVLICRKLSCGGWWYNSTQLLVVGMFWAVEEKKINMFLRKYYYLITPIVWMTFFGGSMFTVAANQFGHTEIGMLGVIISAVLFVFSVNLFTMKFRIGNPILNFFGNISYEFYLIHSLYISLLLENSSIKIRNQFLGSCVVLVCSIVSAYLLHKLCQFILSKYTLVIPRK